MKNKIERLKINLEKCQMQLEDCQQFVMILANDHDIDRAGPVTNKLNHFLDTFDFGMNKYLSEYTMALRTGLTEAEFEDLGITEREENE